MSTPSDLAEAVQSFAATVLAAIPNPADAIDILSQITAFAPAPIASTSAIGQAQSTAQGGVADLCRRAVLVALAQASATYQPTSYDDAAAVRDAVCTLIDQEILNAGDEGQDETFLALKALRAAVTQDLTARGATLAPLITLRFGAPLPALTLAYRLYGDISRADQLINFADAPHPAFLPVSFRALAS
jgi:prophage DNA circulation protein